MVPGEAQSPLKITITLTIAIVAVVVGMAGTTIAEAAVGAAVGAATGVVILQSLWGPEACSTGAVAVTAMIVTAVAGGLAGTAAGILQLLAGAESLTGSAVIGVLAGAAIVVIAKAQLQWVINTIQWAIVKLQWATALVKRATPDVQYGIQVTKDVLPTTTVTVDSGASTVAAAAPEGETLVESATSGPAVSARAIKINSELMAGTLGLVAGAKTEKCGSQGCRQLQTEASGMRDKSTEMPWTEMTTEGEQSSIIPDSSEDTEKGITKIRIPEQTPEDCESIHSVKQRSRRFRTQPLSWSCISCYFW
ncbi:uncharacterized protein LOC131537214 [Onychostoma macrolepis]|uniref:uncharacterized protein LOC131537214 n=1 Tax=Onychostoma macrolepis TaxID=369639 RepID=UPI00272D4B23|nr:uncharacterized protein LOC131537214 [Onychostoma macrolepis]